MRSLLLVFTLLFISACVSYEDFDTNTAAGSFGLAKQLEEDERYEESVLQYRDVKNRFPYSRFAIEAELRLAEVQFKKEAYPEAQASYQLFKELHPKHEKIDYVTFQVAESIFQQLPSTIDRDLSLAPQAIRQYRIVLSQYPQSTHVTKSKERVVEARKMLAEKSLYIADFYYRTKRYVSALVRYEKYIKEFPDHGQLAHGYYRAGLSAEASKLPGRKSTYFRYLIEKFPNSSEAQTVKGSL